MKRNLNRKRLALEIWWALRCTYGYPAHGPLV